MITAIAIPAFAPPERPDDSLFSDKGAGVIAAIAPLLEASDELEVGRVLADDDGKEMAGFVARHEADVPLTACTKNGLLMPEMSTVPSELVPLIVYLAAPGTSTGSQTNEPLDPARIALLVIGYQLLTTFFRE